MEEVAAAATAAAASAAAASVAAASSPAATAAAAAGRELAEREAQPTELVARVAAEAEALRNLKAGLGAEAARARRTVSCAKWSGERGVL